MKHNQQLTANVLTLGETNAMSAKDNNEGGSVNLMADQRVVQMLTDLAHAEARELNAGVGIVLEHMQELFPDCVGWVCLSCRDDASAVGWEPISLLHCDVKANRREIVELWFKERDLEQSPSAQLSLDGAGTVRAVRSRGRMTASEWDDSFVRTDLEVVGMRDRLVGGYPVGTHAELFIGLDKPMSCTDFTPEDEALLETVMHTLHQFARCLVTSFGILDGDRPFTKRERETLGHLLSGASEKQIAGELGLKRSSLHQLVVQVYRKLGVQSRPELMALWLDGSNQDDAADRVEVTSFP